MKAIIILALLLVVGCGGGGATGDSIQLEDRGGFGGTYTLRDENCIGPAVKKFRVSDWTVDFTISVVDPGSTDATEGDVYYGSSEIRSDTRYIDAEDTMGCVGTVVIDEDGADYYSNINVIDVRSGDMFALCFDDSADGQCALSYKRS